MFQFLIGRVKSGIGIGGYIETKKFQFLIGRVKRKMKIIQCYNKNLFQFLIGRVKSDSAAAGNNQIII